MDLPDYMRERDVEEESPLASKLHPRTLNEVAGQQYIVGKDKLPYRAIQTDKLKPIIFYGPSGTGKATLTKAIANTVSTDSRQISATVTGKRDIEEVVKETGDNIGMYERKAVLLADEIHRLSEGQQDHLLPFAENGALVLIGATMENPYLEVNGALLSRSRIFELKPLKREGIKELIRRATYDRERGVGVYDAGIDEDAAGFLADTVNGDARVALSVMELGVLTTAKGADGRIHIDMVVAQERIQKRAIRYDKNGDDYYNTISAFIKSMWGSNPGAVIYYLVRMLHTGEGIKLIVRGIMICVVEDVRSADPQVLAVMVNVAQTTERTGIPEASIILSRVMTYVVTVPKNNAAYMAIQETIEAVRNERTMSVLVHLQDKHCKGAEKLGRGADYLCVHNCPKHYAQQQYLPENMEGTVFYESSDNGYEKQISTHMKWLKSWFSQILTLQSLMFMYIIGLYIDWLAVFLILPAVYQPLSNSQIWSRPRI